MISTLSCWTEIRNLKGHTLKTLDRRKPFQVVEVTEHNVIVVPIETGKERPVPREGIEKAYRQLIVKGSLTRSDIMKEYSPFNPAYVAALLAELPGVQHSLRPIVLRFAD
jgi:hypothetical protein